MKVIITRKKNDYFIRNALQLTDINHQYSITEIQI